jgi:chromosome segregation ATPase
MKKIILPKLNRVGVADYDLYREDISFTIHEGVNIIIGGNGLGKTTFLNLIIFGMTGKEQVKPRLTSKYFMDRVENKRDLFPKVTVEFSIGDTDFLVRRDIRTGDIDILEINDKGVVAEADELEAIYNKNVIECSNFGSFNNFCFILKSLLYAGEDRKLILWDLKTQTEVLGLLFVGKDHIENYFGLLKKARDANTQWRHAVDDNGKLEDELKEIEIKRENILEREPIVFETKNKIRDIENEIRKIRENLDIIEDSLKEKREIMEKRAVEIDKISEDLENLDEKLKVSELVVHQRIYPERSPIYEEAKYQLENYGICIFCRSRSDEARNMATERESNKRCIVCGSPLKISQEAPESSYSKTLGEIDELSKSRQILEKRREELRFEIEDIRRAITSAKSEEEGLRREEGILKLRREELRSRKEFLENEPARITEYDLMIYNYINLIEYRKEIIAQHREAWERAGEEFEMEVERMRRELRAIMDNFGRKFQDYASKFLGKSCELEQRGKRMKTLEFELPIFYPKLDEKTRDLETSVSETQRLFLDHAYRFAIISLIFESTQYPVLYFAETPEAFSDVAYIKNIAEMFSDFCREGHTVIITSNLSSKTFLSEVLKDYGMNERKNRVLNLLELGKLTEVQEKERTSFDILLKEILGGES